MKISSVKSKPSMKLKMQLMTEKRVAANKSALKFTCSSKEIPGMPGPGDLMIRLSKLVWYFNLFITNWALVNNNFLYDDKNFSLLSPVNRKLSLYNLSYYVMGFHKGGKQANH